MERKHVWLSALGYRDFRLLWGGELVSAIGTDMQFVALSWQLYLLTHSAVALGSWRCKILTNFSFLTYWRYIC